MVHGFPDRNPCWAFENRLFSSMCFTSISLISLLVSYPGTDLYNMGPKCSGLVFVTLLKMVVKLPCFQMFGS